MSEFTIEEITRSPSKHHPEAPCHPDRFKWLIAVADRIDPTGQLRLILVLAFFTGRWIGAITRLKLEHLGLATTDVRHSLRQARSAQEIPDPIPSESWAEHWPHGAIHWIGENDKVGYDRVVPVTETVRAELDRYLRKRTEFLGVGETPWLFAHSPQANAPLSPATARKRLRRAEGFVRPLIEENGLDPEEIMPPTPGKAFSLARELWSFERLRLGWNPYRNSFTYDIHSPYVGGWSCTVPLRRRILLVPLDPRLLQACVDGLGYWAATDSLSVPEDVNLQSNPNSIELGELTD